MKKIEALAIEAAKAAGDAIMDIYHSHRFEIELKNDNSPLTLADKSGHEIITSYLNTTDLPVLSEEGAKIPYEERKSWETFWIVDPLDGTKEFIKRNGEFTVNIGLVQNSIPIFGVVYAPAVEKLFYGGLEMGAFLIHEGLTERLYKSDQDTETVRIVASRSHLNQETQNFISSFKDVETVSMGSSLKFMALAEGKADYYPRFAPTMEWDTAAAHAIVAAMGFSVKEPKSGNSLVYNKKNLLNPYFLVS